MNHSDEEDEKFSGLITAMAATFGREADTAMMSGYEMGLGDLPIEAIARAVRTAIRTCKFMPTAAELRDLAGELSPQDRAIRAWDAFAGAVQRLGYYRSVDFDDATINATVRSLGGWERVCVIDDHKEFSTFLRKDFERIYISLYRGGISAEQAQPLIGYSQKENQLKGYGGQEFNGVKINQIERVVTGLPPARVAIGGPREQPLLNGSVSQQLGVNLRLGADRA